jgi:hypothetical protein
MRAVPIGEMSKAKVKLNATAAQEGWQAVMAYQPLCLEKSAMR